jgi:putative glutathione S-transferase
MGRLIDGVWHSDEALANQDDGSFRRAEAQFRSWVTPDGAPGPSGEGGFPAEAERYHLYVSYACPWANRALFFLRLKGLEEIIGVSVVHPDMLEDGWTFDDSVPGATGDRLHGLPFLRDIYLKARPGMSGRVTVPVLWDCTRETIVSNESAEIIRMFNSAFDGLTGNTDDYWPEDLRAAIEPVNARVYDTVNNGVYKAGFARSQAAYDAAAGELFETLDWLEDRLASRRYLMGDRITEADWRLFSTLARFDLVYHTHFKCNRAFLREYPALWAYTRELYQWQAPQGPIAETLRFDHIVRHYYGSHESINPHRIVPINPKLDWSEPHGREGM